MTQDIKTTSTTHKILLTTLGVVHCLIFLALLQSTTPEAKNLWHKLRAMKASVAQRGREILYSHDCHLWCLLLLLKIWYSYETIHYASVCFSCIIHLINDGILWIYLIQVSEYYADTQVRQSNQTLLISEPHTQPSQHTLLVIILALVSSISAHHFEQGYWTKLVLPCTQLGITQYLLLQLRSICHPIRDFYQHNKAKIFIPEIKSPQQSTQHINAINLRELCQKITTAPQLHDWLKNIVNICAKSPHAHPVHIIQKATQHHFMHKTKHRKKHKTNGTLSLSPPEETMNNHPSDDSSTRDRQTTLALASSYSRHLFSCSTGNPSREQLAVWINNLCRESTFSALIDNHLNQYTGSIGLSPRSPRSPRSPGFKKSASTTLLFQMHHHQGEPYIINTPHSQKTIEWQVKLYQLSFDLINSFPYRYSDNWVAIVCNLLMVMGKAYKTGCQEVTTERIQEIKQTLVYATINNPQLKAVSRFSIATLLVDTNKHSEAGHYFFQAQLELNKHGLSTAHIDSSTAISIAQSIDRKALKSKAMPWHTSNQAQDNTDKSTLHGTKRQYKSQ